VSSQCDLDRDQLVMTALANQRPRQSGHSKDDGAFQNIALQECRTLGHRKETGALFHLVRVHLTGAAFLESFAIYSAGKALL